MNKTAIGYVKTENGTILVQHPDNNEWGFSLSSDDQSWAGGFGWGTWHMIDESEVPEEVKENLGWIIEQHT